MNRGECSGFDLPAVPKYPWESGEEWDQRRMEEIQRRLDGERSEYPHVVGPTVKREYLDRGDGKWYVTHEYDV